MAVGVIVRVGVNVAVGVLVGVSVKVGVGAFVGVDVSVGVGVRVGVGVSVGVGVLVRVGVGVSVGVGVGVSVSVGVSVGVGVLVGVNVGVGVGVGVSVGVGVITTEEFLGFEIVSTSKSFRLLSVSIPLPPVSSNFLWILPLLGGFTVAVFSGSTLVPNPTLSTSVTLLSLKSCIVVLVEKLLPYRASAEVEALPESFAIKKYPCAETVPVKPSAIKFVPVPATPAALRVTRQFFKSTSDEVGL